MRRLIPILFLLFAADAVAQFDFELDSMLNFNTEQNQMVCADVLGRLVIAQMNERAAYDDRGRSSRANYDLTFARKGSSFNELTWEEEFPYNDPLHDDGTCCFSISDSVIYFSSSFNFGNNENNLVHLFSSKLNNGSWDTPVSLDLNLEDYNSAHPSINDKGDLLIFSSDRPGGLGKMDLWYCNLLGNTWSEPVWLGDAINSPDNEVFPTFRVNDIYYSSDRKGCEGYDLFAASKKSQWKEISKLPPPFNSVGDDIQCVFLNNETAFIASSRPGGAGGDDVFLLREKVESLENYTALVECLGRPLRDVNLRFSNALGELVYSGISGESGDMQLENLSFKKNYTVDVSGIEDDVLSRSVIYIKNDQGEIIKTYRPGKDGQFYFELLQGDDVGGLKKMDNPDESILKVSVQGQIFEKDPGDIGEGELIYVTDEAGELLALTYTTNDGRFKFDELRPLRNYQFRVTEDGRTVRMIVDDGESDVEIPFVNGAASYQKLADENSIQLIDEHQKPIFIANDEVFIIRNIYYQFDSVAINSIAKGQLQQMGAIMKNNPLISIELSSHTDSRGELGYNLELSNRRALRANDYLQSIGVSSDRIESVGYGEQFLLNECADGIECPEESHALNRRTEIKIHVEE